MMNGWRRAFCTHIPKEREEIGDSPGNHHHQPKTTSRFGFFSNPSTPRLQSRPVSSPTFSCRTSAASTLTHSLPNSPKLQCKTSSNSSPRRNASPSSLLSFSSNPSSPKSPASFSILKAKLGFNKSTSRCGICLQTVKTGQGTAIFTAACSHSFHFPCIVARAASTNGKLLEACPVCCGAWGEASFLPLSLSLSLNDPKPGSEPESKTREAKDKNKWLRVYNDDEPLISSPISLARFNPIPESDENDDADSVQDNGQFQGFSVSTPSPLTAKISDITARNVEVELSPESAIVAAGKGLETYAVVMKVRAPAFPAALGLRRSVHRAPVDLVTVLDVRGAIQVMKRAMKVVISLLSDSDRLSVVVFSSSSKRLLPLRRMTAKGRRSARRIVEALAGSGEGMTVNDALKKAAKVIEDRRQRNVVTSIIVLSDGHDDPAPKAQTNQNCSPVVVSTTRTSNLEIPVHNVWFSRCDHALPDNAFAKRIHGLLSVSVHSLGLELGLVSGSGLGEIVSVYSMSGRPAWLGSGSIQLGDLYSDEERELLVEVRARGSTQSSRSHSVMTVRSSYVDPTTQDLIHSKDHALMIPRPHAVRSSSSNIGIARVRSLHVSTRAIAESRRLIDRNDLCGAQRMLTSALALLRQYGVGPTHEWVRGLEAELAELNGLRERRVAQKSSRNGCDQVNGKAEVLTPTSAWRAAERLAKVAIMRKHMNRVSDLHGFENARF